MNTVSLISGRLPAMRDLMLCPYVEAQMTLQGVRQREDGQTITEYALIIASIAILFNNLFHSTGNSVENPGPLP
jgi:hypothetical protein